MTVQEQISELITTQPDTKRADMQALHNLITEALPDARLWYDDGRNADGKVVTNPTIGYGQFEMKAAKGQTRDYFQIGLSATKSGFSVYILGLADKAYLKQTYGGQIGKATVTGYCISFKNLKDIHIDVLTDAIKYGVEATAEN